MNNRDLAELAAKHRGELPEHPYGPGSATYRTQALIDAHDAEIKRLTVENAELRRALRVASISVEAMALANNQIIPVQQLKRAADSV